jgi:WD40 repeat protein
MKKSIFLIVLLFLAFSNSLTYDLHAESDTLWTKYIGSTVRTVKFSPDGRFVYAAVTGRSPMMLDANTGDIVREFKEFTYVSEGSYRLSIAVSKDGKRLFAGDNEAKFYVWDTESGELIKTVEIDKYNTGDNLFYAIDVSEKHIVYNLRYKIGNTVTFVVQARDINTYELIKDVVIKNNSYLLLSNDGSKLAVAGISDKNIELFETETWGNIGTLVGHQNEITDLSFSPDGSLLASIEDKVGKIWDIELNKLSISLNTNAIYSYSLQLVSNNLLTLGNGDTGNFKLKTTDLQTKKDIYSIPIIPIDFDYNKNQSIIVANYKNLTLVKADKLSSIPFTIGKNKLFPNPANQNLTIPKAYFNENFLYFNIIDMTGKEVYKYNKTPDLNFNEDLLLDVSSYLKGSYIVQLFYTTNIQTLKFIKE